MAGVLESQPRTETSRVIERQLDVTRRQVWTVEIGAVLVAWLAGVILYLLSVIVIDHWIVTLGVVGRLTALLIFLGGSAAYFALAVWPLLMRRINPVYAARAIEESSPSLKNSLINFLLLKKDNRGVKEAILSAVERRAASDITAVPIDMAVDRSKLIRLGYVLVGSLSLFALYKIQSPKDPFRTVARMLAPWADIEKPARVSVTEVAPGDQRVYFGRVVPISCKVTGLRAEDRVRLLYSTTDGQAVDREVAMTALPGGLLFEGRLPPDGQGPGPSGLQQDLVYRILAGDAETKPYRITVAPAPTIVVDKLQYDFKRYTRRARQEIVGQGDLHALEGTKVTVFAQANQPIKTATLEFDPPEDGSKAPEVLPLKVEGDRASVTFTLQLQPDRAGPWRTSYQLRFTNEHDERNEAPIVHRIQVTPDLGPEIQWLTPNKARIDVPEDGSQKLELRAIDPDFGLQTIKLIGEVGDKQPVNVPLFKASGEPVVQQTTPYVFRPADHKLEAGDEITVWGVAEDNRVSALKELPEPNTARTPNLVIRVTPGAKPKPEENQAGGQNKKHPGENDPNPQPKPGEDPNKKPGEKPGKNDKQDQQGGGEEGGEQGAQNKGSQSGKEGEQNKEGGEKGNQGGNSAGGGEGSQTSQNQNQGGGGKENGAQSSQGNSEGGNADGQAGQNAGGKQADSGKPSGQGAQEQGGADQPMGSSGGKGSGDKNDRNQSGGERDPNAETEESQGGGQAQGKEGGAGKSDTPHDGDVFEKVLDNLKKNAKNGTSGKKIDERPQTGDNKNDSSGGQDSKNDSGRPPQDKEPSKGNQGNPQSGKPEDQSGGNDGQGDNSQQPGGNPSAGESAKPAADPNKSGFRPAEQKPPGAQGGEQPMGAGASGKPNAAAGKTDEPKTDGKPEHVDAPQSSPNGENKKPPLPDKKQGEGGQQNAAPGEGGAPQKNPNKTEQGPKAGEAGADRGEKKEPGAGDTGNSGAGKNSEDKSGNGPADGKNRDKNKTPSEDGANPEKGEAAPPSQDKRQSDSQGEGSGQNSGGGNKGAGQPSKQEGNDSPGSKSAADQGAGKANEQGNGETGDKAGGQEKANGKTGRSSQNQPGKGSDSGKSESGEDGEGGQPGAPPKSPPASAAGGDSQGSKQTGPTNGGGKAADGPQGGNPAAGQTVPDSDAANLEYSRKATNLVLDHLRDQQHNPDPDLLKQLNMTPEQLRQFVRRWESLQKTAQADPNAKQELDESLKSLGLRPPKEGRRAGQTTADDQRGLQDAGGRTAPPTRYQDQFEAFRKGVGRGK